MSCKSSRSFVRAMYPASDDRETGAEGKACKRGDKYWPRAYRMKCYWKIDIGLRHLNLTQYAYCTFKSDDFEFPLSLPTRALLRVEPSRWPIAFNLVTSIINITNIRIIIKSHLWINTITETVTSFPYRFKLMWDIHGLSGYSRKMNSWSNQLRNYYLTRSANNHIQLVQDYSALRPL